MKRAAFLGAPAVTVALAAGYLTGQGAGVRVWEGSKGKKLDFVGVCSYAEAGVRCWDTTGKPYPELSARVESYFGKRDAAPLTFKYGLKNRLAVFRAIGRFGVEFDDEFARKLSSWSMPEAGGATLFAAAFSTGVDDTVAALVLKVDTGSDEKADVRVKPGQVAVVHARPFQVLEVGEPASALDSGKGPIWQPWQACAILFDSNLPWQSEFPFAMTPLNARKEEIRWVDSKGRPAVGVSPPAAGFESVLWEWQRPYENIPEIVRVVYNVACADLAYLRVSRVVYVSVPVPNVPLEPRR